MKRRKKEFSITAFIQKMLLAIFIIALIEIPVVYYYANNKNNANTKITNQKEANKAEKNKPKIVTPDKEETPVIATDIVKIPTDKKVERLILNKQIDSIKKTELLVDKKPETIKAKETAGLNKTDTTKIVKTSVATTQLTEGMMDEVLNNLNSEKEKLNINSKCVKVQKTTKSNVSNGFKIVDYLKSKGFSISGREEISSSQKGIHISTSGGCMVVTIGTL